MPPFMAAWAGQQLRKINGKDDLTLLEFCMSLTDASEIRQYLAAYLGSTPEVCMYLVAGNMIRARYVSCLLITCLSQLLQLSGLNYGVHTTTVVFCGSARSERVEQ